MFNLTPFQIIVLLVLALLLAGVIAAAVTRRSSRRESLFWGALCVLAAVATVRPSLTTDVAAMLKIGRGADLVFYVAVVMMMIGFWMTYMRLRHLRRELTSLVRHIAILEAHEEPRDESKDSRRRDSNSSDRMT